MFPEIIQAKITDIETKKTRWHVAVPMIQGLRTSEMIFSSRSIQRPMPAEEDIQVLTRPLFQQQSVPHQLSLSWRMFN